MPSREFIDQMGNRITCNFPPKRIISLVPSQTELLADLALSDTVVGITNFCIHPQSWHDTKTKVGGTKKFNFHVIDSLNPDLIIGNKEENYQQGIQELSKKYPVWMSDIYSLEDAYYMMNGIGEITDRLPAAQQLIKSISESFRTNNCNFDKTVLYLIWRKPWMAAGTNTFIHDILSKNGFRNVVDIPRYPELSIAKMKELDPEVIFLSSEPFPFAEKHSLELKGEFPKTKIILVDGEMFSWYGSRLLLAPEYFTSLPL